MNCSRGKFVNVHNECSVSICSSLSSSKTGTSSVSSVTSLEVVDAVDQDTERNLFEGASQHE